MSETYVYPSFYKPIEASEGLEPEQLEASRRIFNDLFDDVMLPNMGDVKRLQLGKGQFYVSLRKRIEVDDWEYSLTLDDRGSREPESSTGIVLKDNEITTRDITIQRIGRDDAHERELWSYRLGLDGIVRRWDGGDVWGKRQKERELGIEDSKMLSGGKTKEEISEIAIESLQTVIENSLPNSRLAEDMGLNKQPVTPEELEGLRDFLNGANYSDLH